MNKMPTAYDVNCFYFYKLLRATSGSLSKFAQKIIAVYLKLVISHESGFVANQ